MNGRHSEHGPARGQLAIPDPDWVPHLGDLIHDSAAERTGVVVDVPGGDRVAYHLRPPGGGHEWTAARDGSTLTPAPGGEAV